MGWANERTFPLSVVKIEERSVDTAIRAFLSPRSFRSHRCGSLCSSLLLRPLTYLPLFLPLPAQPDLSAMSGPSFTSAAISTMRANQPQHGSAASVPRHTYSSSYARDYADIQSYNEYLQAHADANAAARSQQKAEAQQSSRPRDTSDMLRHERGDYDSQPSGRQSSRKPYEPVRAPYAQDEPTKQQHRGGHERDASYDSRDRSSRDRPSSAAPNRYQSTAQESYTRPESSSGVSARMPLAPSKQMLAAGSAKSVAAPRAIGETPWASDVPEKQASRPATAAPAVPALALNKVSSKSSEPYSTRDEPVATRQPERGYDDRDRDYDDRGNNRDRNEREPERQRGGRDDYEQREGRWADDEDRYNNDSRANVGRSAAPPRDDDDEYSRYEAPRDARGPDEFARRQDLDDEPRRGGQYDEPQRGGRDQYDEPQQRARDQYDDEDQVSRPMENMRVGGRGGRDSRDHDQDYDREPDAYARDERSQQPQQRRGRDDDDEEAYRQADRGRDPYQSRPDDRSHQRADSSSSNPNANTHSNSNPHQYERVRHQYDDDDDQKYASKSQSSLQRQKNQHARAPAPYSDNPASDLSMRERQQQSARMQAVAAMGDAAAGARSRVEPYARDGRAHAPIFGPATEPYVPRPSKKAVPEYDAWQEKRKRSPKRALGHRPYDPTAAGARTTKSINRYANLDAMYGAEGEGVQLYSGSAEGREEVSRRGVKASANSARANLSIRDRNPILQDSEIYDNARASHESQRRIPLGMHPSVESAKSEPPQPSRRGIGELQVASASGARQSAATAGVLTPDRGVRLVGDRSHRHSNIFGSASIPSSQGATQSNSDPPPRGIKVNAERNASAEVLAGRNLLYDQKPMKGFFDREQDEQQGGGDRYSRPTSAAAQRGSDSPYGRLAMPESARVQRSAEQQAERDAYEAQLRRLHEERQDTERRSREGRERGHQSNRLW